MNPLRFLWRLFAPAQVLPDEPVEIVSGVDEALAVVWRDALRRRGIRVMMRSANAAMSPQGAPACSLLVPAGRAEEAQAIIEGDRHRRNKDEGSASRRKQRRYW